MKPFLQPWPHSVYSRTDSEAEAPGRSAAGRTAQGLGQRITNYFMCLGSLSLSLLIQGYWALRFIFYHF